MAERDEPKFKKTGREAGSRGGLKGWSTGHQPNKRRVELEMQQNLCAGRRKTRVLCVLTRPDYVGCCCCIDLEAKRGLEGAVW